MAVVIDGTNGVSSPDYEVDGVTGQLYPIVRGTAVTASGTSVDFTGIPSWAKRITVMFSGVSTNGTSGLLLQIGNGSLATTGYASQAWSSTGSGVITTGFALTNGFAAAITISGVITIANMGDTWASAAVLAITSATSIATQAAGNSPSGLSSIDRVRITTVGGANTFDAGTINILYE
jgi:hypothetical protein